METIKFSAKVDGVDKDMYVRQPNFEERREGQRVKNRAFKDALDSKAVLRAKLNDYLKEQGLWDDKKQMEFDTLSKRIRDLSVSLKKGGIKLNEARSIALKIRTLRDELVQLTIPRLNVDSHTAEAQSRDMEFNYYVSTCTRYSDDNPVFTNFDEYISKSGEEYAVTAAQKLAKLLYGVDDSDEDNLPENQFLRKFKFVDSKGRLINKNGHLVDEENRLIDEQGRFVTEKGELVDIEGRPVTDKGDFIVDEQPFLDDDTGEPIVETQNKTDQEVVVTVLEDSVTV